MITVEAGKLTAKEAQRVADLIHAVLGLEDVNMEVMRRHDGVMCLPYLDRGALD